MAGTIPEEYPDTGGVVEQTQGLWGEMAHAVQFAWTTLSGQVSTLDWRMLLVPAGMGLFVLMLLNDNGR